VASNPVEIILEVFSKGAISVRFELSSDVNRRLDNRRSAPDGRGPKGKLPDDLSLLVYVCGIEGMVCLYVYPLLNTGIPNKFLAALRINRSVVVVSIPFCSLRGPEKDGAGWTDDLPRLGIDPVVIFGIPNEILAGLGIKNSFRIPGILSRPLRQFESGDRGGRWIFLHLLCMGIVNGSGHGERQRRR